MHAVDDDLSKETSLSERTELESGFVLRSVSCVYAEDTRHTKKLFSAFGIEVRLFSCHSHNEIDRAKEIVKKIDFGEAVAIVSDAGTPMISDPGGKLISMAIREGVRVTPIPGPSAAVAALVGSGFDASSFLFIGFLPKKQNDRRRKLQQLEDVPATLIVYVAPTDLVPILRSCIDVFGDTRKCCVAKEITKIYESFDRGSLGDCLARSESIDVIKGEITLLIEGATLSEIDIADDLIRARIYARFENGRTPLSEAVKQVSTELGVKKRRVYKLALSALDDAQDKEY